MYKSSHSICNRILIDTKCSCHEPAYKTKIFKSALKTITYFPNIQATYVGLSVWSTMFSNQAVQVFSSYTLLYTSGIESFLISSLQQQLKRINDNSLSVFQVSIVLMEKTPLFWDITLCSAVERSRRFD